MSTPYVNNLADMQRDFMRHLYNDDDAILAGIAANGPIPAQKRMRIYRNTARQLLSDVLAGAFPAVMALVDEKFFRYAADEFIAAHPPTAANLNGYGAALPDFLAAFKPLAGHPYIPDLARLEWARHEAYHAQDGFDGHLPHALRLLRSDWPIDKIWAMAQPGFDGETPDLSAGGARIAIAREGMRVFHIALNEALFSLLEGGDTAIAAAPAGVKEKLAGLDLVKP